jgi:hypothetical protein
MGPLPDTPNRSAGKPGAHVDHVVEALDRYHLRLGGAVDVDELYNEKANPVFLEQLSHLVTTL